MKYVIAGGLIVAILVIGSVVGLGVRSSAGAQAKAEDALAACSSKVVAGKTVMRKPDDVRECLRKRGVTGRFVVVHRTTTGATTTSSGSTETQTPRMAASPR